jgi:hypothetical protein
VAVLPRGRGRWPHVRPGNGFYGQFRFSTYLLYFVIRHFIYDTLDVEGYGIEIETVVHIDNFGTIANNWFR